MFLVTLGHDQWNRRTQFDFQLELDNTTPARVRGVSARLFGSNGWNTPVYVRKDGQNCWQNRKWFLSQNVLAVVGFDMWFHYILAGWEGRATDARVLYSALEDNLHPLKISHGKLRQKKNCTTSSLRTTVERVFGLLKIRFSILKNHVSYQISTQVKIVQAACVLHNFIINHNPNEPNGDSSSQTEQI
ncbi:hypothetical protein EJ110_NYTH02630 [Nymphaea thermarum]|nr:hypothetical protein EJ110_NYTH02630 [Nymphaea thermarum]